MISAYQAGVAAGNVAKMRGEQGQPMILAHRSLAVRRLAGIVPLDPSEDYLRGFGDGFEGRIEAKSDGLCLAEDEARRRVKEIPPATIAVAGSVFFAGLRHRFTSWIEFHQETLLSLALFGGALVLNGLIDYVFIVTRY